jgi:hypothetical protein
LATNLLKIVLVIILRGKKMNKQNGCDDLMHVLMHGRRAAGGSAPGNMPMNSSQYRKGGPAHKRHRHAVGGPEGVSPVTGAKVSSFSDLSPQKRYKGGKACHADGDSVGAPVRSMMARLGRSFPNQIMYKEGGDTKMKRGGHKPRHRHDDGGSEEGDEKMRRGGHKKKKHERS